MRSDATEARAGASSGIVDKRGILPRINGAKLDLGCGHRKRGPEYIGIDILDGPKVDLVGDVFAVLDQMPCGSVSRVYSSHFFEHVSEVDRLLTELARVLTPGGELEVIVPHFSNPYFYSDLTHRSTFGLYSFSYYVRSAPLKREVPRYGRDLPFRLVDVSLGFKSAPPFYGRHVLKRITQTIVNASRGLKEFYEENLCYLLPCYEVRFLLVRN